MPPTRRFQKEEIIKIAFQITKDEGFSALNARRIAKELGCSIQPIFHNFKTMEELKKEVYQRIYQEYQNYMMRGIHLPKAYKEMGLSYIQFAKDYPEFFKILFMQQTNLNATDFVMNDKAGKDIIEAGQKLTKLSYEEQQKFHVKVWIFTHGIACLVATKTIQFKSQEIENLLEKTVQELLIGYQQK